MRTKQRITTLTAGAVLWLTTSVAAAQVDVTLAHFAPVDGDPTVDVVIDGTTAVQGLAYGDIESAQVPSTGTFTVDVVPAGGGDPLVSEDLTFGTDGGSYTTLVTGGTKGLPLDLLNLNNEVDDPASGTFNLRIVHAAPFDDDVDQTGVTIRTLGGDELIPLPEPLEFGEDSGFLTVDPSMLESFDFKVTSAGGYTNYVDPTIPVPGTALVGQTLNLVATGDGENQPIQVFETNALGTALDQRPVVDQTFAGEWFNAGTVGEGIAFRAIPKRNRLTGTWFTGTGDGSEQQWFVLASEPGGFVGLEAEDVPIFKVTSDLAFNTMRSGGDLTQEQVGTATVTFAEDCSSATVDYDLSSLDLGTGTIELQAITGFCARSDVGG